jgi:P27 family predicted phage terminase small subunit
MSGPPPKPTPLKIIAGNPGKKRLPEGEVKPKVEMPSMPKHLNAEARAEWDRLGPVLVRLKLLTRLDRAAFAAYCMAWSRHVEAEEQLAKASALAFTANGYPIVNPWATISKQAVDQMAKFLGEFGLTPASRTRINVGQVPSMPDDEPEDGAPDAPQKRVFQF